MWRPERLRREPLAHLPALLALALAATSVPARAELRMLALCSGGSAPAPSPARRDCDQACHIGCTRGKRAGVSGRL